MEHRGASFEKHFGNNFQVLRLTHRRPLAEIENKDGKKERKGYIEGKLLQW
jgi:hypothetical protein